MTTAVVVKCALWVEVMFAEDQEVFTENADRDCSVTLPTGGVVKLAGAYVSLFI